MSYHPSTPLKTIVKAQKAAKVRAAYAVTVEGLTAVQQAVLDFIEEYIAANQGRSPSIREIMKGLGYSSPAPVQSALGRLREKHKIAWEYNIARSIKLLGKELQTVAVPLGHSVVIVPPGFRAELVPVPNLESVAS